MDENKERPFFAYCPDHAIHAPFLPKSDLLSKYERKVAGKQDRRDEPACTAMIEAVDQNAGRIMANFAGSKLTENSLVIFTSENGGTQ